MAEKRAKWWKMMANQRPAIESIPDEEVGRGLKAAYRYFDGEQIEDGALTPLAYTVLCILRPYMDDAAQTYESKVTKCRAAAEKRKDVRAGDVTLPAGDVTEEEGEEAEAEEDSLSDEKRGGGESASFTKDGTDATAARAAQWLAERIAEAYPALRPPGKKERRRWAESLARLHDEDGYEWETIERVMLFSRRDAFWRKNIRSAMDVRRYFDRMLMRCDAAEE